jgi:hypothetical protein
MEKFPKKSRRDMMRGKGTKWGTYIYYERARDAREYEPN